MNRLLLAIGVVAAISSASPARADNGPAPSALQRQAAKERFYKGLKLSDRAEHEKNPQLYEGAYVEFVQAWATFQTDKLLWNLALSALRTNRYVEAISYFKEYDRRCHVLADAKHPDRDALKKYLAEANAKTVHVTIEADAGERIFVDEKPMGAAPLADTIDLVPGRHVFKAGAHVAEATLPAGTVYTAKLRSEPPAVQAPLAAATPVDVVPAPSAPTSESQSPGSPPVLNVADADRTSNAQLWWTVGLGATSAVLLGGGLYFGAKSASAANDSEAAKAGMAPNVCPSDGCASLDSSIRTSKSSHTVSVVFFGAAGAAAVGAGVAWFVLRPKTGTTMAMPLIAPGVLGAQWNTSF